MCLRLPPHPPVHQVRIPSGRRHDVMSSMKPRRLTLGTPAKSENGGRKKDALRDGAAVLVPSNTIRLASFGWGLAIWQAVFQERHRSRLMRISMCFMGIDIHVFLVSIPLRTSNEIIYWCLSMNAYIPRQSCIPAY